MRVLRLSALPFLFVLCVAVPGHAEQVSAAAAPPQEQGTVRVASINMWGIPYVSTHIDVRFAALAERLNASDLDVIGLQEMWAAGPRVALCDAVRARFPYQVDFQSETGGSGLVILSRWPILEQYFVPFPLNGKPWQLGHMDWWSKKGVGLVRLDAPGGAVWFATTHLHARYMRRPDAGNEMDDQYAYDRWHQTHVVRALVAQHALEEPAIVVGDFNFTKQGACYAVLSSPRPGPGGVLLDPAWRDVWEDSPLRRIDLIWSRPGTSASWATVESTHDTFEERIPVPDDEPQRLSDHHAVRATLRRVPTAAAAAAFDPAAPGGWPSVFLSPRRVLDRQRLVDTRQARGFTVMMASAAVLAALGGVALAWRRGWGPGWFRAVRAVTGAALLVLAWQVWRVNWQGGALRIATYEAWVTAGPGAVRHLGLDGGVD